MSRCPMCGGEKAPGRTTYSAELGTGVVVVRNVPAEICKQCGEEWIGPDVARALEQIVEKARLARAEVEVVAL
jgi:YgiT-type zinc finger domain-containing protein